MSIWKRALLSIIRRKLNSLVLLLIIFILANVLLTTLTVTTSLKSTKQIVLKQFPPVVTVEYNYENFDANSSPKLTVELANKLYADTREILKSYDYSLLFTMTKNKDTKYSVMPNFEEYIGGVISTSNTLVFSGTQLSSTNLVAKGEAKLINGKGFSESDIKEGKPKAIVSKQFAEANQLMVGSVLPVSRNLYEFHGGGVMLGDPYYSEEIELEIVGIIEISCIDDFVKKQGTNQKAEPNDYGEIQNIADKIYVPNNYVYPLIQDNAERANEQYHGNGKDMPGTSQNLNVYPEFVLNDMSDLNTFVSAAKKVYNEKDFTIISAASEYEKVAKPTESMGDLLDLIFKTTVLASIIVLTLVMYIFMYLRQKEMGVFLALGERRTKIIGQLLMETLIIALIGATLAIFTSMIFSNMLTENTISSLLAPTTTEETLMIGGYSAGITPEMISTQFQGGLNAMTLVAFYGVTALTIFISQIATTLYLLRLNPKKILM